jgi:hypothetical protein
VVGGRRCAAGLVVLVALGALPASAGAYSTPSGLTSSSSLCPPRPADAAAQSASAEAIIDNQSLTPASGAESYTASVTQGGGLATLDFYVSAGTVDVEIDVQDSAGSWHAANYDKSLTNAGSNMAGIQATLPPGPVRVGVFARSTGALVAVSVTEDQGNAQGVTLEQELVDACYGTVGNAAQAHSDAGAVDSDVKAVKSSVDALQGSGATSLTDVKNVLGALTGASGTLTGTSGETLSGLDVDLRQLDADVKAGGSSGSSGPQLVELSSADRQLTADAASSTHGDLWVIVGAVLCTFVAGEISRRVLPS